MKNTMITSNFKTSYTYIGLLFEIYKNYIFEGLRRTVQQVYGQDKGGRKIMVI